MTHLLLGVLNGDYDALCWEPRGAEGTGVELWFEHEGVRTYLQSKRQNSDGNWTIHRLDQEGIFTAVRQHLHGTTHRFWFVSQNRSPQLASFLEEADTSQGNAESFLTGLPEGLRKQQLPSLAGALGFPLPEDAQASPHLLDLVDVLRRVEIRVIDERMLRSASVTLAGSLVEGEATDVVLRLKEWAHSQTGKPVRAVDIRTYLQSAGMPPRDWSKNAQVLARIETLNAQYVNESAATAETSHFVERTAVLEEVWERLQAMAPGHVLILHGTGGTGKSTLAGALLGRLRDAGLPSIGFRLDQYPPLADAQLFGEQALKLPASPVRVMANVAQSDAAWLLIDQLDEVSEASGRHASFFGCVQDMRNEQTSLPGVRLVLICRTFDLRHDHRIAQLAKRSDVETYEIPQFSEVEVCGALERLGFDSERFSPHQRALLQIPRLLGLLAEIAGDDAGRTGVLSFQNENDLYAKFWEDRDRKAALNNIDWVAGVDRMVAVLSREQQLSAPRQELGVVQRAADWLVSNHVLILQDGRYRFFHEGFFDYAFARRFVDHDRSLEGVLQAHEQSPYWRRPIRQVLRFLRDANPRRYHHDLRFVLQNESVRPILKQSALGMLGQLTDPTVDEWRAVEPLIHDDGYLQLLSSSLWGSSAWFALLTEEGVIASWMRGAAEPGQADLRLLALSLARESLREEPDAAHRVLAGFVAEAERAGADYPYLSKLQFALEGDHDSRPVFDLYLRLVRSTDLLVRDRTLLPDGVRYGMGRMRKHHPEWACELVGVALQRWADLLASDTTGDLFMQDQQDRFMQDLAADAPAAFVQWVLPAILYTIEASAEEENPDSNPQRAKVARRLRRSMYARNEEHSSLLIASKLLDASQRRDLIDTLRSHADQYEDSALLLAGIYKRGGTPYADEALNWLAEDSRRFERVAFATDGGPIRAMLCALARHARPETVQVLEQAVMSHHFEWEARHLQRIFRDRATMTVEERMRQETSFGSDAHLLLSALPSEKLTDAGRRAQAALFRKFGEVARSVRPTASWVGPPRSVSRGKPQCFRDEDWLRVLVTYANRSHLDKLDDIRYGGAEQLANVLQGQAKEEPARFAALAERLEDDLPSTYFTHLLLGVAEGEPTPPDVVHLSTRCHALPGRPCGQWISWLIQKHPSIPQEDRGVIAEMLTWYAVGDSDPVKDQPNVRTSGGRNLVMEGINSVRGSAAQAIQRLLFEDADWLPLFLPTLQRMIRDPEVSVRAIVASTLLPVLNHDRDLAVGLFIEMIADAPALLLGSRYVEQFINHVLATHHDSLKPYLLTASSSDEASAAEAAARQLALTALFHEGATVNVEELMQGSASVRVGVAQICAYNLGIASDREACAALLSRLFNDEDAAVRKAASECFDHLDEARLGDYEDLARAFLASAAFEHEYGDFIRALEKSTRLLPSLICEATDRMIARFGHALGDVQQAPPMYAQTLGQLLFRVLSVTYDSGVRTRCLDGLDSLLLSGSYGITQTLDQASAT